MAVNKLFCKIQINWEMFKVTECNWMSVKLFINLMLKTLAYTSRQSVYPQVVDFFELFLSVHFLFWEFLTLHLTFALNVTLITHRIARYWPALNINSFTGSSPSRPPLSRKNPSQWHGHPRVLGIPIPKARVIWASPSQITLAIWVRVRIRVTGDAHIIYLFSFA